MAQDVTLQGCACTHPFISWPKPDRHEMCFCNGRPNATFRNLTSNLGDEMLTTLEKTNLEQVLIKNLPTIILEKLEIVQKLEKIYSFNRDHKIEPTQISTALGKESQWTPLGYHNHLQIIKQGSQTFHHLREVTLFKYQENYILKFAHQVQRLSPNKIPCSWVRHLSYSRRAG